MGKWGKLLGVVGIGAGAALAPSLLKPAVDGVKQDVKDAVTDEVIDEAKGLEQAKNNPLVNLFQSLVKALQGLLEKLGISFAEEEVTTDTSNPDNPVYVHKSAGAGRRVTNFFSNVYDRVTRPFRGQVAMSPEIRSIIHQAAERHGVDPRAAEAMAAIESRGDPHARNKSGAAGLFQFMPRTAAQYGLTNPFDAAANADAAMRLWKDNARYLRSRGIEPTPSMLYLAHQQGPAAAAILVARGDENVVDVLSRIHSREFAAKAVVQNGGKTDMTAGQFAGLWLGQYNGAFEKVQAAAVQRGERPTQQVASAASRPSPSRAEPDHQENASAQTQHSPTSATTAPAVRRRSSSPTVYAVAKPRHDAPEEAKPAPTESKTADNKNAARGKKRPWGNIIATSANDVTPHAS